MKKLKGKIIVITGGTSGIGKYFVEELSANNTVINLARSCETSGDNIRCDVSVEADVNAAFQLIKSKHGKIDVLINNAGYALNGATELLSDEDVARQFEVNFMGVFRCVKNALPMMDKGGKIINISSACAIFPLPFRGMYCASKAAVSMLSHSLREEVKPYGIQVTALCPGDIQTSFSKNRVKVIEQSQRYGDRVDMAFAHIEKREGKRMTVDYAGKKMLKIMSKKKLKPFYIVGRKYKFLYALYRIFPLNVILSATGKMFAPKK